MAERELDFAHLAREGYDAYGAEAQWKTFDGRPMPTYEAVGPVVQKRWEAAAKRIATLALLACVSACATFQQPPVQPLPTAQTPGGDLAQCVGWQTAGAAWATVQVYVSQVLEQQRTLACTLPPPTPPAQPTPPAVAEPSATPTQQ